MRLGYGIVAAVFGGLLFWSIVAPIDGAVIATGQVVVEGNRKTVQHLEGGVIAEILVKEGEVVEQGDLLIRLDSTVSGASLGMVDEQLSELYARRARLVAEQGGKVEVGEVQGQNEIIEDPQFQKNLRGQVELLSARIATLTRQISLLEERIIQQRQRIEGLTAQRKSVTAQLRLIEDELDSVRLLYAKGFAPLTRLRALERESESLTGERGALIASIAEAQSLISETTLEIERMKETAVEEAITELREVEVQIAELEERRVASLDTFVRTNVVAPQSGQVMGLSVHTQGGVLAPGAAILDIVPDIDRLEIAARVSPGDIEKVIPGQEALVRFSSFSVRQTPEVIGAVRTVSGDSLIDEITGAPYYLVLIDLPANEDLAKALSGQSLVPGMPGETFIRTGKQPAISYILRPLTDALARSLREE